MLFQLSARGDEEPYYIQMWVLLSFSLRDKCLVFVSKLEVISTISLLILDVNHEISMSSALFGLVIYSNFYLNTLFILGPTFSLTNLTFTNSKENKTHFFQTKNLSK